MGAEHAPLTVRLAKGKINANCEPPQNIFQLLGLILVPFSDVFFIQPVPLHFEALDRLVLGDLYNVIHFVGEAATR